MSHWARNNVLIAAATNNNKIMNLLQVNTIVEDTHASAGRPRFTCSFFTKNFFRQWSSKGCCTTPFFAEMTLTRYAVVVLPVVLMLVCVVVLLLVCVMQQWCSDIVVWL